MIFTKIPTDFSSVIYLIIGRYIESLSYTSPRGFFRLDVFLISFFFTCMLVRVRSSELFSLFIFCLITYNSYFH